VFELQYVHQNPRGDETAAKTVSVTVMDSLFTVIHVLCFRSQLFLPMRGRC